MAIDATFWVAVSFIIFFGVLIYLKVPQKINEILKPGGKLICQINHDNKSHWINSIDNLTFKSAKPANLNHLGRKVKGWYAVWQKE